MIKQTENSIPKAVKAVGLLSGGLDSILAAKIVKDLGVEVHGVYFSMPWGCCDKTKAMEAALSIGISFITLQLDERYLKIVEKPKYGYGTALNPCVDCRVHMFSRAAQYMKHIEADFVFTGEVLGQRPMSQMLHSLKRIEEHSGLQGRLLRPLSAQLLDPTIPEIEGAIDRTKLLKLNGRSRKGQLDFAAQNNITAFNSPAGGCLLTDHHFATRMKDTLQYGYRNFRETIALKWGRHYRFNKNYKMIVGRDEEENLSLVRYAHKDDYIMQLADNMGPILVLKGERPSEEVLQIAGGLIQRFSRYKDAPAQEMVYWPVDNKNNVRKILAKPLPEDQIEQMKI